MRLPLRQNLSFVQRLVMRLVVRSSGFEPGPVTLGSYRKRWVGEKFVKALHAAMVEAKHWRRQETELFAAFVSNLNACVF